MRRSFQGVGRAFRRQIQHIAPYPYTPLPKDNSKIRILTIFPGRFDDDIYITLSVIAFDTASEERYGCEALSYMWGSEESPQNIYLKDESTVWKLSVTRNCDEALRYLRHKDKPRTLWIDAICIDQRDLDERARQVSVMRHVYSKASQVIVWLGPASDDSDVVLPWIDGVAKEVASDYMTEQIAFEARGTSRERLGYVAISQAQLNAFASLLQRSYFDRLWVWQEVRMGGDTVRLKCGNYETDFSALIAAIGYCRVKLLGGSKADGRVMKRVDFISRLPLYGHYGALGTLDRLRNCRCKDQRDRIFTLSSFLLPREDLRIAPDYTQSTWSVYINTVLRYIHLNNRLDFLQYAGDNIATGLEVAYLPSWIPDWSIQNTASRFANGFSTGSSQASIIYINNTSLTVRGVKMGNVFKSATFGSNLLEAPNVDFWHEQMCRTLQIILPIGMSSELHRQVARVLTQYQTYLPEREWFPPTMAPREAYLEYMLSDTEPMRLPDEWRSVQGDYSGCVGRSVFSTREGKFGLGPHAAQEGDTLALLLGCETIMVLRPSETHQGHYRIIGNALCTGLVDGEGILGRLPVQYEFVMVNGPRGDHNPAFREVLTGKVTFEDPRLPPLPPNWKDISEQYPDRPLTFRNGKSGEVRGYRSDPRLDADALKNRGVKLEEFCLA